MPNHFSGSKGLSTGTAESLSFLRRIDLLVVLSAIVTLFLALTSEPWWTLSGTGNSRLFSVQISPFYLHINATGLPSTLAIANILGALTRVIVFVGFVSLLGTGFKPTAWWRSLAMYFGLASLAELYLSFILMYYWAETAFVGAYGVIPPFYGTTILQASILGLDLKYYANPVVTATFALPYYLGYLGLSIILCRSMMGILRDRALRVLSALLPGGSIHDIYLTPPYQHVWFSSGDRQFNPLGTDPGRLNDDELLVSFQKLYETVEPGGSLSIILPAWATGLADRFQRLMPDTGFMVESAGIIYRIQGRPENELRFRKPIPAETRVLPESKPMDETGASPLPAPPLALGESAQDTDSPPVLEVSEEPWVDLRMTRIERVILKSAVETIARRQEPVPYRELLNQVYMDLVDRGIDFDSARQIENTLLDHNGRELLLVENADEVNAKVVKKWWLGGQKIVGEKNSGLSKLGSKIPRPQNLFRRLRKPRYKPTEIMDDDPSLESSNA